MERDIEKFYDENVNSGVGFKFCRIENLQAELITVGGFMTQEVFLKPGTTLFVGDFLQETLTLTSKPAEKNNDQYRKNVVQFTVPKDRAEISYGFDTMLRNRYFIIYEDGNGFKHLLGDLGIGCKFYYDVAHGNGTSPNEYKCRFEFNSKFALPVISPTVSNDTLEVLDAEVDSALEPFG